MSQSAETGAEHDRHSIGGGVSLVANHRVAVARACAKSSTRSAWLRLARRTGLRTDEDIPGF